MSVSASRAPLHPAVVLATVLVAVLTALLRIPHFFEPPWHDDAGIYAAIGHGILRGQTLYVDVLDNRPPGLYLLYAGVLALSQYFIPSIAMAATVFFAATQAALFCIAREIAGTARAFAVAILWGVVATLPYFDGDIPNAEIFMALPTALGMLCILRGRFFLAGMAFGSALLLKQIAAADVAAAVIAVVLFAPRAWPALRNLALGAAIPLAGMTAWLLAQGIADEFLYAGFGYYLSYVQRDTRVPREFWALKLALLAAAVVATKLVSPGPRSAARFRAALPFLWLAFALYGSLFTSRPYPHYLQQTLLPLALVTVLLLTHPRFLRAVTAVRLPRHLHIHLRETLTHPIARALPALAVATASAWLFTAVYFPWAPWARWERTPAYYQNFLGYMSGQRDVRAYNMFFDRRVTRNLALARYLKSHAKPSDSIMVWGEEPWLYVLSELKVGLRFTVGYFAWEMPDGLKQVVQDLQSDRPRFVVWTQTHRLYPELKAELDRHYELAMVLDNVIVLERRDPALTRALP